MKKWPVFLIFELPNLNLPMLKNRILASLDFIPIHRYNVYVMSQFYFPFSLFIFSLNVIGFIHQTSAEEIPAELRESIVLSVKHIV